MTRSPQWAGGLYDGRIRLAVGGGLDDPASLDRVVVHELAHAFVQHIAPGGVPAWLHEGLAVLFEQGEERWIDQHLRAAGRLPSLSSLEGGFAGLNAADAILAYAQSAAAARVLINRLGPNLAPFLQSLDRSQSLDAALANSGSRQPTSNLPFEPAPDKGRGRDARGSAHHTGRLRAPNVEFSDDRGRAAPSR